MNVKDTLEASPMLIAQAEEKVARSRRNLDAAKHQMEVVRAKATLLYQTAKNQTIMLAQIAHDTDVVGIQEILIQAQLEYQCCQIDLKEVENAFIAARKLAGMQITAAEIRMRNVKLP